MRFLKHPAAWLSLIVVALWTAGALMSQTNISGGTNIAQVGGSAVATAATGIAKLGLTDGTGNAITSTSSALDINLKSGSLALGSGSALVGFVMSLPAGCSGSGSSLVVHNTVGIATGAGTSVSSATGCIVEGYVNNITNSAVTLRIADKTGTPIIWLGGNADFTIPGNSSMGLASNNGVNLSGIIMASGITAIAGTASALNLHLVTRE